MPVHSTIWEVDNIAQRMFLHPVVYQCVRQCEEGHLCHSYGETPDTVQGEAAAGLAAIASLNKTHLPEAPLADMGLALGALRPISDAFAHARLQRRILLLLLSAFALALV